eukprot:CAMPEP_0115872876 /NCGR_PEP_ID=MMETSP0287-20121206/23672_1 /TAXON_ID=412157 /ORGANISM="Chrysochromulina rotalis, Strain UIO044" /LENGTH=204 /DNA_ID=CAMNT_0003327851 /DNA_START=38 /DNA_END=652 /DNA_ORIENTATION=-
MPHENVYFAEKELCSSRLNDHLIDRHWKRRQVATSQPSEEVVIVARRGVCARVTVPRPSANPQRARVDDGEPVVAGGAELLASLSQDERQQLLSVDYQASMGYVCSLTRGPVSTQDGDGDSSSHSRVGGCGSSAGSSGAASSSHSSQSSSRAGMARALPHWKRKRGWSSTTVEPCPRRQDAHLSGSKKRAQHVDRSRLSFVCDA